MECCKRRNRCLSYYSITPVLREYSDLKTPRMPILLLEYRTQKLEYRIFFVFRTYEPSGDCHCQDNNNIVSNQGVQPIVFSWHNLNLEVKFHDT